MGWGGGGGERLCAHTHMSSAKSEIPYDRGSSGSSRGFFLRVFFFHIHVFVLLSCAI